ncbi:DNA-binding SARP family transcriptional activator [Kribbella sp. VKM Ac-2527]|uniref:DNA-binding SARP family transcriptional activator n=1 Tax=Kribbella caucasensis TaxID=2512215 RepID=A0A4R6KMT1_9ACTN|nr:AfsR/SARP family transcriptional regulator [Kribbella sp. VKM Ac-2527]TDO50645.1 DNA-binding SARP family transcriptional activator [Kribbella sp. VKM Ac-2527]
MNGHSAQTSARIAFRVLGPLEVDGPDREPLDVCGGKPATVLTLLLLHRNAWVSTDQLIEAVWAGLDVPASAQRNLKTYVWQLRRALPGDRIESRPGAYRVHVRPGELDADLAADLSDQARKLLLAGNSAAAAANLVEQALGLWRGCPYDGLTGDATSAVERLTELHRSLREDLADAHLDLGRSADAISLLRALTDEDPLRELTWTKLLAALRRTGRRHDALAAYQRARTALVRELGIEPGAELTALHQAILNDDAPAEAPLHQQPTTTDAVRSDLPARIAGFVGRGAELAAVANLDMAAGVQVVTIDGMPGIGKTAFALEAAATITRPDGKFYLDLRTHRDRPIDTFDALGELIHAAAPSSSLPSTTAGRAACWRSLGLRILLVLDDVADAEQVRQLLPNTPGSVVLVISRPRLAGLDRDAAITLDVLADADAARLTDSEPILRCCAGHPAALRRLAERVRNREPWTAARLTARLDDRTAPGRELADVHALFEASYRALSEPVRRIYRLLGLTPQFDVRRAARLTGLDQQEVEPMVDELLDRHLVAEPAPGRFALHPLVRDHAHRLLLATESDDDIDAASARVRVTRGADLELVSPEDPRVA